MSLAQYALARLKLDEVTARPGGLSARWTSSGTPWQLETIVAGPRLVGTIAYRNRLMPVILEPKAAGLASER